MMKQAEKITAPAVMDSSAENKFIVTNEDRIDILMKQGTEERVLLRKDKINLIKKTVVNKNEVVSKACLIDVIMNCDLSSSFEMIIPKNVASFSKQSNKLLSEIIVNLFELFEMVHNYLVKEQFGGSCKKLTRNKKKRKPTGTVYYLLAEEFVNLRDRIDCKVILLLENDKNPLSTWMVNLSDVQR